MREPWRECCVRVDPALWPRHLLGHRVPPVTALRDELRVPQTVHQDDPGARDANRVPAGLGRLSREPVAGQGRDHEVEGVGGARPVFRGIGERVDELQLLDGRSGPAVGDDDRQRVRMLGAGVDEVDVDPVDLRHEVRQRREALLERTPVIVRRPVVGEGLDRLELHALGGVGLPVGPLRHVDAAAQVVELLVRHLELEATDGLGGGTGLYRHGASPVLRFGRARRPGGPMTARRDAATRVGQSTISPGCRLGWSRTSAPARRPRPAASCQGSAAWP